MSKHLVRVRALSNVLGLRHGDVVDVIATPRVETLIRGGHLEWVDEAGAKVEYVEAAEEPERETIGLAELREALGFTEDDAPDVKASTAKPSSRASKSKVADDE